jgi:heptosyltransferase-3
VTRTGLERVRRILFLSLSPVGDVVMTTPVLEALHQACPGAVVDIIADQRSSQLLIHCPYRGEILHKDKDRLLRGVLPLLLTLWRRRYDLIVDLRTDGLAYLFRGRRRLTKWHAVPYGPHAVEVMMGVIRKIQGDAPIPPCKLWLSQEERDYAAAALAHLPPGRWLVLGPGCGGSEPQKVWPEQHYIALADALKDVINAVILVGSPGDAALTAAIAHGLTLPHVDLAGATTLLQAAAVMERASLFVGSDSGLGHVAAAVGTPTLSFFSTDRPERCRPWGNKAAWLLHESGDARLIPVSEAETAIRTQLL